MVEDVKVGSRWQIPERMYPSKRRIHQFTYVEEIGVTEIEREPLVVRGDAGTEEASNV
jgi:hypothetical protein